MKRGKIKNIYLQKKNQQNGRHKFILFNNNIEYK